MRLQSGQRNAASCILLVLWLHMPQLPQLRNKTQHPLLPKRFGALKHIQPEPTPLHRDTSVEVQSAVNNGDVSPEDSQHTSLTHSKGPALAPLGRDSSWNQHVACTLGCSAAPLKSIQVCLKQQVQVYAQGRCTRKSMCKSCAISQTCCRTKFR